MAESPSQSAPAPVSPPEPDTTSQYWCYHCNKRVFVETLASQSDVICLECKNGFVELISVSETTPPSATPSLTSDTADDSSFGSQFLQMLHIIAQAARDEDAPPNAPLDPPSEDDFLRIELNGWDNDEEEDDDDDDDDEDEEDSGGENREEVAAEEEEAHEDGSDDDNDEENREDDEEELRRRRRDILRLRIRDFATRARSGRNRILDWAEILMGLEDNSIEFRLEVPETDRYIGNPEDYVDAAGYEALLQNLAESDNGRRGAPPASKSAISALPTAVITSEMMAEACAICKDMMNVGETQTKLPCGHGYHGDCIVPWLDSRNSCPVCRFELPTDDVEYEEDKKKKANGGDTTAAASVGGASGSGESN